MADTPRRPKRTIRAPVPLYVPDENVRLTDDFNDSGDDEEEYLSDEIDCDDTGDDDSEEDDEDRTEQGYAKDGFVVDDDDMSIDSDYYESEDEYIDSDEDYSSSDDADEDVVLCDNDNESITQEEHAQG